MKKLTCILITVLLLFSMACSKNPQNEETAFDPDSVEYIIYLGNSDFLALSEDDSKLGTAESDEVKAITKKPLPENCEFFNFTQSDLPDNEKASKTKSFSISGKNYELEYFGSRSSALASSDQIELRPYGKVDRYSKPGDYVADFSSENGQLRFFLDFQVDQLAEGDFDEEGAVAASKAILADIYGNECLEYYADSPAVSNSVTERNNTLVIKFIKSVGGYPTNDEIEFCFNKRGELISVNANQHGLAKPFVNQYSVAQLQAAENELNKYFNSQVYSVASDTILLINSDGECYLEIFATYQVDSSSHTRAFYINVE